MIADANENLTIGPRAGSVGATVVVVDPFALVTALRTARTIAGSWDYRPGGGSPLLYRHGFSHDAATQCALSGQGLIPVWACAQRSRPSEIRLKLTVATTRQMRGLHPSRILYSLMNRSTWRRFTETLKRRLTVC